MRRSNFKLLLIGSIVSIGTAAGTLALDHAGVISLIPTPEMPQVEAPPPISAASRRQRPPRQAIPRADLVVPNANEPLSRLVGSSFEIVDREAELLQRLLLAVLLPQIVALLATIAMGDADAPPFAAHFRVVDLRIVNQLGQRQVFRRQAADRLNHEV